MREPATAIASALEREEGGLAVIWCPDLGLREWLVDEVESLAAPDADPVRADSVEAALQHPDRIVLLVPSDEREAVLDLDGSRDRILDPGHPRTQPIVLFLMREGAGRRALAEAPSLAGLVHGSDPDPEELAAIDLPEERAAFEQDSGTTPEAWLAEWRGETLPRTSRNFRLAYRASLLENA